MAEPAWWSEELC